MHITKPILMCTSVTHPKKQLQFIRDFAMVCKKANPLCMTECYAIFLYVKKRPSHGGQPLFAVYAFHFASKRRFSALLRRGDNLPNVAEQLFFYRCKRMLAQMQKDQCVRIIQIPNRYIAYLAIAPADIG